MKYNTQAKKIIRCSLIISLLSVIIFAVETVPDIPLTVDVSGPMPNAVSIDEKVDIRYEQKFPDTNFVRREIEAEGTLIKQVIQIEFGLGGGRIDKITFGNGSFTSIDADNLSGFKVTFLNRIQNVLIEQNEFGDLSTLLTDILAEGVYTQNNTPTIPKKIVFRSDIEFKNEFVQGFARSGIIIRELNLIEFHLKDCCGELIAFGETAKNDCRKKPYPPKASECCAYAFASGTPDKLEIVYTVSDLQPLGLKSFLVVSDKNGEVFRKEIKNGVKDTIAEWNLKKTNGDDLFNVLSLLGKSYDVQLVIRNQDEEVLKRSGILPVFVDTHQSRNALFETHGINLPTQMPIAEVIMSRLLSLVSDRFVELAEKNLRDHTKDNRFRLDDPCILQCVNRTITLNLLAQFDQNGSCWEDAVAFGEKAENDAVAGQNLFALKDAIEDTMEKFEACENIIRAKGYTQCGLISKHDEVILKREIKDVAIKEKNKILGAIPPALSFLIAADLLYEVTVETLIDERLDKNFNISRKLAKEKK